MQKRKPFFNGFLFYNKSYYNNILKEQNLLYKEFNVINFMFPKKNFDWQEFDRVL